MTRCSSQHKKLTRKNKDPKAVKNMRSYFHYNNPSACTEPSMPLKFVEWINDLPTSPYADTLVEVKSACKYLKHNLSINETSKKKTYKVQGENGKNASILSADREERVRMTEKYFNRSMVSLSGNNVGMMLER